MQKPDILYLQLPLLDTDAHGQRENFPFAAAYLDHALRNSPESGFWQTRIAPESWDELGTPQLAQRILSENPAVLAVTLYLWNIERTLALAEQLKKQRPGLRIVGGGPEAAPGHPLLARAAFDAVVFGEGEAIFPALLTHWRTGEPIDYSNLSLRDSGGWTTGSQPPPPVDLAAAQPSEQALMDCSKNRPVTYIETVRGCPLTCTYCRYHQSHTDLRTLPEETILRRISNLKKLGAREIRFVDPTFNARSHFTDLLRKLAQLNRDCTLSFFAEIRADTLTDEQAGLMGRAGFSEVEIGVQSIDPLVLKKVQRPENTEKTARAVAALRRAGVEVVLDVMYGLPGQHFSDVIASIDWCRNSAPGTKVQCMQTLALPGTVLRGEAGTWAMRFGKQPPYGVEKTGSLSAAEIRKIETRLHEDPELPSDPVTPRFCGERLSGIFKAHHRIRLNQLDAPVPGRANRRAIAVSGTNLFTHREKIGAFIIDAIKSDPHTLWQFILEPESEEPLDLLDFLCGLLRKQPAQFLDRFASAAAFSRTVSRRLYVRTKKGTVSADWKDAADELLRGFFG